MRLTPRRLVILVLLSGALLAPLVVGRQPREAPAPPPVASEAYPNAWPTPPPADVAALFGGLGPGAALTPRWRVRGISPVHEQRIVLDVASGDLGFRVAVKLKERDERVPPKRTARYALYTIQPRPSAEQIQDPDYAEVLTALAAILTDREGKAPVPAGL